MDLVFQRFLAALNEWMTTGEFPRDEFRVRGTGPRSSRWLTRLTYAMLALLAAACIYLALVQA